ncbi:HEAT repeat domain-containing protein [Nostoc sp.]|uniref:HEAT repeat domain-containing protein n=1 Tax=Nostoc sp. TaxID=1180 RepID=UPI002FF62DFE
MLITPRHTNKRSLFFLFWFTLLLTLFLSLPWVNAEEKPKPEVWQINGIVAALKDPIPEVRATATQNLQEYQLDNPKSQIKNYDELVKQFAKQLQDKDSSVSRKAAIKALGQMQAKEKIPLVAKLLKDSGTGVRGAAVKALGQMQAKEVVPQVVKLLTNPDSGVRKAAAEALGQMQAKEQIPILVHLLTNPDGGVRGAAIEALGQMQAKEQAPQVAKLLKDSDGGVRGAAIEALGQMQAKEVVPQVALLLTNPNVDARYAAIKALGQMQAKEQIPILVQLLKNPEGVIRDAAVKALGQMQAKEQAPQLILLLKEDPDSGVRKAAAEALIKLGQQDLPVVVQVLDSVHSYPSEVGQIRFVAHFLGGGKPQVETLMQWVGKPKMRPEKPTHDQGVEVMEVFKETWKHFDSLPELRRELAEQISEVAAKKKIIWKAQDINLLQTHYSNLKKINSTHADTLQSVINNVEYWQWFFKANNTILIHAAFWLALIFAYPKFPQVQAIFFWNPWVRRILGVGYVGFLLTWFPPFRRKLFEPFKPSLLADAGLDNFYEQSYFPESKVKVPVSGDILPITPALPSIQGQIILEGDSGLGKSMFLRHLLKNSQRIVVYLPAQKCNKGVIEAIQDKLHGQAQDAGFLKNLIYSGAIDICIDGLNEVTAETRAKICQFVESYFRGNIIMTTQPLEWTPPSTAKIYYLHPLEQQQIQQFLISRQPRLPKDAKVQGDDYAKACTNYLTEVLNNQQVKEELNAAQRTLSNPMDLTVVALMLSQGKYPNLFRLQEQQYNLMAAEYLQEWKQEFPLKKFSAAVYQMRLEDKQALPADEFHQVVMSLSDEKYKMVVSRQWEGEKGEAKKEWYFRHDKIMDFFLVQNFLGETDAAEGILVDRMGDPRFRGVYFLLATLLPLDAAKELREKLIQYAADTKDNTVSNTFVQLLRTR